MCDAPGTSSGQDDCGDAAMSTQPYVGHTVVCLAHEMRFPASRRCPLCSESQHGGATGGAEPVTVVSFVNETDD